MWALFPSRSNPDGDDGAVAVAEGAVAAVAGVDGDGDGVAVAAVAGGRGTASWARTRWNSDQCRRGTPCCRNTPRPS